MTDLTKLSLEERASLPLRDTHDESMRMQALAIGARLTVSEPAWRGGGDVWGEKSVRAWAAWSYREATGREW